jgi:hypothetical protein
MVEIPGDLASRLRPKSRVRSLLNWAANVGRVLESWISHEIQYATSQVNATINSVSRENPIMLSLLILQFH